MEEKSKLKYNIKKIKEKVASVSCIEVLGK